MKQKVYNIFRLIRVKQWIKNSIVFTPLFFSGNLFNGYLLIQTIWSFIAFCLISSSVYCFNDIIDRKKDQLHPVKCHRPIASGTISIFEGYVLMCICALGALLVTFLLNSNYRIFFLLAMYWLMNIAYCLWLKHIAIIDITCISIGFVFRLLAGGLATEIVISQWLLLMTYLMSLFLALAKRYDDILISERTNVNFRSSIVGYNRSFVAIAMTIAAAIIWVCYIMYTMSTEVVMRMGTNYVLLTSVWVVTAALRFLQVTLVFNNSGSPTQIILKDRFLWLCFIGWLSHFFIVIYSPTIFDR